MEALFIFAVPVAIVWICAHYSYKAKSRNSLTPEDEHMIEDMWKSARGMERRLQALEAILEMEPKRRRAENAVGDDEASHPASERLM